MPDIPSAAASTSASESEKSISGALVAPTSKAGYVVAALGGIAIAAGIVLATSSSTAPRGTAGEPAIQQVALADISGAITTLAPNAAAVMGEEAKRCKAPLAEVVLKNAPGAAPGLVRIRSGSYVSPPFTISDAPQRIAIPFPTPYQTGRGVIVVEGANAGATISLYPTNTVTSGSFPINIWWTPQKSC
jgi:hypothetical protein